MGNKTSTDPAIKNKHVIIVGASFAGFEIASKLWDHLTITMIDMNDYMEHICYSFKTLVEPNFS
jgi:NADH dehydrogenase FAD-containing subunit